jgi:TonB-dependent starch-binding outer membrane protein SusC
MKKIQFSLPGKKCVYLTKLLLFMKLTTFLLLISLASFAATGYSQVEKVTIQLKNGTLKDLFGSVEQQTSYKFLYRDDAVENILVTLDEVDEPLDNIMNQVLADSKFGYKILANNLIVIAPTKLLEQIKISGTVTDENGIPLPGVNVQVEGSTVGTISDAAGKYSLEVPNNNAVLIFSFIGYLTQTVTVMEKTTIDIVLLPKVARLDEVLVIGYGTVKRRDLTGSVASIKTADITRLATNNPLQSMQGKIAGIDVIQSSGATGSDMYINLRGNRSINASNAPLFLVDGIEYGSTLDINASDIASIDVLKDASSTAIYGTRGANGVIIITTKTGLSDAMGARKTKVSINSSLSFNSPTSIPDRMNVQEEYLVMAERQRYYDEAATGTWGSTKLSDYPPELILSNVVSSPYEKSVYQIYKEGGINPYDLIIDNSLTSINEISLSGGDPKTSFNLSLGYMNQNGLLHNDNLKRYNFRINLDHKITKTLRTGINILYTLRDWNRRDDGMYYYATQMYAISQPFLADGTILTYPSELGRSYTNPLLNEEPGFYQNNLQSNRLFGNLYLEWEIVKGLRFKSILGIDTQSQREGVYEDYMAVNHLQSAIGSTFSASNSGYTHYSLENTLKYSLTLGGINEIQLLAGQTADQGITESHGVSGIGPFDHFLKSAYYDLTFLPPSARNINNDYIKMNTLSFFGRLNYKLKSKYLLTATIRSDGSSVFSEGNKWGAFPSVAAAWILSEEPFLKTVDQINNLKIRLSWGKTGNSAIYPYQTLTVLGMSKIPYTFDSGVVLGQVPSNLGNSDLSWETTSVYDAGLDISLFSERISATLDFYSSKTYDLLLYRGLPATSVFPQVLENVGDTKNVGFEAALNFRVIEKSNFNWNSDITFSTNKDKIVSLASGQKQDVSIPDAALIVGQPVRAFYNYETDGCWKIDEAAKAAEFGKIPGDIKIKDLNKDGSINELDRRIYNKSPMYIFGWNNSITYKDFTLSALVFSRIGQWISYDLNMMFLPTQPGSGPALDYWTPENQNAKFPRPGIDSQVDLPALAFEKASFLKIQEVTLAYTFPRNLVSKLRLSNLRIYGSLQNYFTFSNIDNYDPERGGSLHDPLLKQVVFGVNLEF